jgi:catechol 2,3-dioxygenase-like lactoylglutathione lyase family enzyme
MRTAMGASMTERTIPILPCRSIEDTLAFYGALGFEVTYRQERPNTFAVVVRGGIELQFFVLRELDPAASYSTCYVLVADVDALHADFAAGLRATFGRVPARGIPRMSAPRDMTYGVRQFIVVDPGGNHIRIGQPLGSRPVPRTEGGGRLERALVAAVTLAESKGDDPAAATVLDSALAADAAPPDTVRVRALVLRAEVAYRMDDSRGARDWLDQALATRLDDAGRVSLRADLRRAADLDDALREPAEAVTPSPSRPA